MPSILFYRKRSRLDVRTGKGPNTMGKIKSFGVIRLRTSQKREVLRSG